MEAATMTLVSVIIPTYNRPHLLPRAVASVYAQSVQQQELIVVGDGTDDESVAYMERQVAEVPGVRFWNLPHQEYPADTERAWGLYGLEAINFGIDQAIGEWIAVLGDDDEFMPDHHRILLDAAARHNADHVYGISEAYREGKPTGQRYGAWPPGDGAIANGANLWRRSLGYRFALDCWDRGYTGDADMWNRMYADGVKFYFVPKAVHKYHRNWPP